MKKIYLPIMSLLVSVSISAQIQKEFSVQKITPANNDVHSTFSGNQDRAGGDPIPGYQDDFSVPGNWTMPTDPDGHAWQIITSTPGSVSTYMGSMASTTAANGFGFFNGVQYLVSGAVEPQDAVIEYNPTIDLTAYPAVILKFQQRYRAFNTDQTFVEVSNNNGASYTQFEINAAIPTNEDPATQNTISMNISAVAGGSSQVKIRFRWFSPTGDDQFGSGYGWMVDDFGLFEAFGYDLVNEASYHRSGVGSLYAAGLEYYIIPTTQVTSINFSANISNEGANAHTGAKLNVTVDKTTNVFTGTSTPVSVPASASDSFAISTAYTPASGLGTYDVTYWVDGTNTEEVTTNDTMYSSFELHDYLYARDNGIAAGSINSVSSAPTGVLEIGNVFEIFGTGVIGGADIRVGSTASNEGQLMYVKLYKYDGGAGDYLLERQSTDYTILNGDLNQWVHFEFTDALDVVAGDDILLVAGHYGGTTPVSFRTAQGVDEQTVLGYIDGSPFYLSSPTAVMIRADMRDFSGITETTVNPSTVGQNVPNPFNNNSVITYTLTEASNVTVDFMDVTGKLVKTITPGTQAAGTYTINVNAADLAEGTYFYTFTIGTEKITKQMVVTK